MISEYSFGSIIIDGKRYSSDIIIFPDGSVKDNWWRDESHRLKENDIEQLLAVHPHTIVVGTGAYGVMKVDAGLIEKNGSIVFHMLTTAEAVDFYNQLSSQNNVGACFHLTC